MDPEEVVRILGEGTNAVFPKSLKKVFLDRYAKMQANFNEPLCEKIWKQGGNDNKEWGAGLSLADTGKFKDALLQIGVEAFNKNGDADWIGLDGILKYPCVGHDLPVWMSTANSNCQKKIMIISQDPLRRNHGSGMLLVSSPFGFHSADYRDNSAVMSLVNYLVVDAGATVYLTDFMKIYNRDGTGPGEPGTCKSGFKKLTRNGETERKWVQATCDCPCRNGDQGCCDKTWRELLLKKREIQKGLFARYKAVIKEEITKFKPQLIVTFGRPASDNLRAISKVKACDSPAVFSKRVKKAETGQVYPGHWEMETDDKSSIGVCEFLHPTARGCHGTYTIEYGEFVKDKIAECLRS